MTTTEDRLHSLAQRRPRDRFPARSARILATGLSVASILGLASAIRAASPTPAPIQTTTELDIATNPMTRPQSSASSTLPESTVVANTSRVAAVIVDPAPAVAAPRRVTLETPVAAVSEPSATTSGSK